MGVIWLIHLDPISMYCHQPVCRFCDEAVNLILFSTRVKLAFYSLRVCFHISYILHRFFFFFFFFKCNYLSYKKSSYDSVHIIIQVYVALIKKN